MRVGIYLFHLSLLLHTSSADIVWPLYNQQCQDDAGSPFLDDEETYGPNGFYHDKSGTYPVLLEDGKCAKPMEQACSVRPSYKAAYLEGPIDCGDNGWYCRIMPDANWDPQNLIADLNFGHCNTTEGFEDAGYDRDGHCHGSSVDSTYYWWIRDHFFRGYNGRLRCCCGWYDNTSIEPLYNRRIANRCDYRRLVTQEEDVSQCRDANEDHGLGFDDIGCDPQFRAAQLNKPIPENDDICWEIQRFGTTEEEYDTPTNSPGSVTTPSPVAPTIPTRPTPVTSQPSPTPSIETISTPSPVGTTPSPVGTTPSPVGTTPTTTPPSPTTSTECSDSLLRFRTENGKGKKVWRDCVWVGNKPYRCMDEDLALHCPETCDMCVCEDSPLRFKLQKTAGGPKIARDCGWVDNKQTLIRCGYDGVDETCPSTCGLCGDGEEDKKNIFE